MLRLVTRAEAKAFDRHAMQQLGIAGALLMENAGRGAFECLRSRHGDALSSVVVVGGPGQNGGDAWVVARHLLTHGVVPQVFLIGCAPGEVQGDAGPNLQALAALGTRAAVLEGDLGPLERALAQATLVVDGLFGTGLTRDVTGDFAHAIGLINRSALPVMALDVPSGVDADTGAVLGDAVRASTTATFAAPKRGLFQHPGRALAGCVQTVHLGVPPPSQGLADGQLTSWLLDAEAVAGWLTPRRADAHKGSAGRVIVHAGSPGKLGAALLAGQGALRAGAGLVTLASQAADALAGRVPELMTQELPSDAAGQVTAVQAAAATADACVLGPGAGTDEASGRALRELALTVPTPAVLDADALTALGTDLEALRNAAGPRVLTPHPGEAARLLGIAIPEVQQDRYGAVRALSARSGQVAVLKGAGTLVGADTGILVCDRGTPAMGIAGMGDVLAGMIAAILAGGLAGPDAAAAGVYLHARAGEVAARADRGLLAGELAASIPDALSRVRSEVAGAGTGARLPK